MDENQSKCVVCLHVRAFPDATQIGGRGGDTQVDSFCELEEYLDRDFNGWFDEELPGSEFVFVK